MKIFVGALTCKGCHSFILLEDTDIYYKPGTQYKVIDGIDSTIDIKILVCKCLKCKYINKLKPGDYSVDTFGKATLLND